MSACKWTTLPDRKVLSVSGSDAEKFLQGIVTNDLCRVGDEQAVFAALLTPQGKILFDFMIFANRLEPGGYMIDVSEALAPDLLKRLGFYKLRADVSLSLVENASVLAVIGDAPSGENIAACSTDPRGPDLGSRVIVEGAPDFDCDAISTDDYHAQRISLGIPEGGVDYYYQSNFPHDANFDFINGIDFTKGCYVGQEVVSRMKHRGTARKRVVLVQSEGADLKSGAEIVADGSPLGALGSVSGRQGLAVVRTDRAAEAMEQGAAITCGDATVTLSSPPYAEFGLAR